MKRSVASPGSDGHVTGLVEYFAHVKEPDSRKTFAVVSIEELEIRSMNI